MTSAAKKTRASREPVLALLREHRAAWRKYEAALKAEDRAGAAMRTRGGAAIRRAYRRAEAQTERLCDRCIALEKRLARTVPRTPAGLLASAAMFARMVEDETVATVAEAAWPRTLERGIARLIGA